jgi:integrase
MLTDAKVAALKPPGSGQQEYPDTKVTGLRLRVGAGGTKTWIYRARARGRTINKKLGTYPGMKLADAREAALKTMEAVARSGSAEVLERTFGALAEYWVKNVARPKNDSWKNQERTLQRHVLSRWSDRKVADIRRADVRELVEGLEGVVLPNRVLTLVKTIFRFALSRDWIDFSPVEGIRKPRIERSRDRVLTMAEVAAIWKATEHLGYPFGPYIRLLCLTAQRRTEVASVRWADLDLDTAIWIIPAALTKSERKHAVPLSPLAVATLKALPRLGDYIFTTDARTHMSNFAKLKVRLDSYVTAAGAPLEPWRLHDLRRSAATHMVRLGVREEVVSRVLNHAPTGITAKVYVLHSYGPEKREALEAWAHEIENVMAIASG